MATTAAVHLANDSQLEYFWTKCVRDDDQIRLNIDSLGEGGVTLWLNDAQYAKVREAINEFEASENAVEAAGR